MNWVRLLRIAGTILSALFAAGAGGTGMAIQSGSIDPSTTNYAITNLLSGGSVLSLATTIWASLKSSGMTPGAIMLGAEQTALATLGAALAIKGDQEGLRILGQLRDHVLSDEARKRPSDEPPHVGELLKLLEQRLRSDASNAIATTTQPRGGA